MTLKSLGDGLRDLADAVETVDMRDRSLAASQRLRTRRITTSVVGAVAVLLVGMLGFNAVWTDRAADDGGPAANQPNGVPAMPAPTQVTAVAEDLSGDFYYLMPNMLEPGEDGTALLDTQSLLRWDGDGAVETVVDDLPNTGTASLSPDGRFLSFVEGGQLILRDLASGQEWPVLPVPDEQLCAPPVWAPDGRRIFVHQGGPGEGGPVGFYDITTATFTQVGDVPGCHVKVWQDAAGRDMLNYTTYDKDLQLTSLREVNSAEPIAAYPWDALPDKWIYQPYSVSPDGDMMCVDTLEEQTFPSDHTDIRSDYCTTVVSLDIEGDATAMSEIPIEGVVGKDAPALQQALMFRDSFVARVFVAEGVNELRLLDTKGNELDAMPEPGGWEVDPVLVGYVP